MPESRQGGAVADHLFGERISDALSGDNNRNHALWGRHGDDVPSGGHGDHRPDGGRGNDVFFVHGVDEIADRFQGGAGFDRILGGRGDDIFRLHDFGPANSIELIDGGAGTNVIAGTDGNDKIDLSHTELRHVDEIDGGAGNDQIIGSASNDVIVGGAGNDQLTGGGGDDRFVFAPGFGHDVINDFTGAAIGGGDVIDLSSFGFADFASLMEHARQHGHDTGIRLGDDRLVLHDVSAGDLKAGDFLLTASGDPVDPVPVNQIVGTLGADALVGTAAADLIQGHDDNDTLSGGAGTDTADYSAASGGVTVDLSVTGAQAVGADQGSDTLANIENLSGSAFGDAPSGDAGDNVLSGQVGDDTLTGGAGNDTLDGGAGSDSMHGGTGDDTYIVDSTGDIVDEALNAGTYTVQSSIDYTLGANVENLTLTGTAFQGTGNEFDNVIAGNDEINLLSGGAGNDTLLGGGGNDRLSGGAGDDVIDSGSGTDTVDYGAASGGVTVDLSLTGPQAIGADQGTDTLTGIENLWGSAYGDTLTGDAGNNAIQGKAGDDTISGGAGNDTLDGGAGNDVLNGGAGHDILIGGTGSDTFVFTTGGNADTVVDFTAAGTGHDTVDLSSITSVSSFADVQAHMTQVGNDAVIDLGGGDTVTLSGMHPADLHADDFVF